MLRTAFAAMVMLCPLAGSAALLYGENSDTEVRDDGVISATNGTGLLAGGSGTPGFTPLPGVTKSGGALSVTWLKHPTFTGVYGTAFVVETSPTLAGPWTEEAADPEPGATVSFPTANEVKYTFPTGPRQFARLKVMP